MRLCRVLTASGLAIVCAGLSVVATAQSTVTIHACVQNPTGLVRIVSASEVCRPGESRVTWGSGGDTTSTTSSTPAPPAPPWPPVFPADALPATGSHDLFLRVAGVYGESTDERHKDWIDIEAATIGAWTIGTQASSETGHELTDLMVLKYLDRSSNRLFEMSQSGEHIPDVIMEAVESGGNRAAFLEVKVEYAVVSSFRHSAQVTMPFPVEEVGFRATRRVWWTYTQIDPRTGKSLEVHRSCWDVARKQRC